MEQANTGSKRPLSPHLSIHKLIPTMVMSILHRVTGVGLYLGTALLAWWLFAAAAGSSTFDFVNGLFGSFVGQLLLLGFTWALLQHMLGGVRHLIWDTGVWMEKSAANRLAWATLIGSLALTVLVWVTAYGLR